MVLTGQSNCRWATTQGRTADGQQPRRGRKKSPSAKFVIAHGILFHFVFSGGKISFSAEEKGEDFFPAEYFHVKVFKTARKVLAKSEKIFAKTF